MRRGSLGCLFELLETLLLTLIFFLVAQVFVAQPYQIQQQSMEDTLMPNQYVLVDKLTPRFDDFHRGDIIVFTPPAKWGSPDSTPYIKRVIGIAGDSVEIKDGAPWVNGIKLVEPYLFQNQQTQPTTETHSWKVGKDQLFVMGDHRSESQDSRTFGPIDKSSVIGRAWLRYWPFEAFGALPAVDSSVWTGPSPSPTPSPTDTPTPRPTATPSASASGKGGPTPKPTAKH